MPLELKNLTKSYDGLLVINDLSFSMGNHGTIKCIIGPNGAGKSTLLRVIYGSEQADKGEITLNDQKITKLKVWKRSQIGIGISFQIPKAPNELKISDLLNLSVQKRLNTNLLRIQPRLSIPIMNCIELFQDNFWPNIPMDTQVIHLTHGDRKKLDILMAVLSSKKLCLLDEPTAGLNEADIKKLPALLYKLSSWCSFLIVEHNMQFLEYLDANISFMHEGKILKFGSFSELSNDQLVRDIYMGKL